MQLVLFPPDFLVSKPANDSTSVTPVKKAAAKPEKKPRPDPLSPAGQIRAIIGPRLPEGAAEEVVRIVEGSPVSILVTRERTSKTGDYRPAHRNRPPRVTVNGNLNPYAFLVTLVHELAHHRVDTEFARAKKTFSFRRKKRPLPHGAEWKSAFRQLMQPFLSPAMFPPGLLPALVSYLENPKASSAADRGLTRALAIFDPPSDRVRLEELPADALFILNGRRVFQKKEKKRSRYRCICCKTGREYLVTAHAPVERV